jgi:glycerophosphoryl diester phosphodiesterase
MKPPLMIFSHRGDSINYPENTIPAFREAIRQGATGLELDVHLSKDDCPIVIHDEYLTRTTNGKGLVKNHTVKQLKKLSAGRWFHPRFHHIKIPTLEEVLVKAKSYPILINVEMKNLFMPSNNLEQEIIKIIHKHEMAERVILSSFNPKSIERARSIDSEIQTGLLYFGKLDRPWKMALELGTRYVQPPMNALSKELVRLCQSSGLLVCPYYVNTWSDIRYALDCKVDGLITMHPARVKNLLN